MPQSYRIQKVNKLIREELSNLLLREVKDPRLSCYISINSVKTSADLRHAKIYVSCVCDEGQKEKILAGLAHSAGYFRTEMFKRFDIRRVPELHFEWDTSIEHGSNLVDYIEKVREEDKRISGENSGQEQ
jgi:ribosome-binding factor A